MHEQHLYEYAVIRVLPKVEREEFINVGFILFSKKAKYIRASYVLDRNKMSLFSTELNIDLLESHLQAFVEIANGIKKGGYVASFDIPERFRWLTAVRSSCIQTSRPHCGFSSDLDTTFDNLFRELVL